MTKGNHLPPAFTCTEEGYIWLVDWLVGVLLGWFKGMTLGLTRAGDDLEPLTLLLPCLECQDDSPHTLLLLNAGDGTQLFVYARARQALY